MDKYGKIAQKHSRGAQMQSIRSILIFLLLLVYPAVAQAQLKVGDTYSGSIKVSSSNGGIYLALPEGSWTLASLEEWRDRNVNAPMVSGGLVWLDGRKVKQIIWFTAGNDANGWLVPEFCARKDIFFLKSDQNRRGRETRCWGINHVGMTLGSNASKWSSEAYQWVARNSEGMPKTMLDVDFYRASGAKYLRVAYYYNPEIEGFSAPRESAWRASEWHKDVVVGDPKRVEYLERLKAWGEKWQPQVEAAFSGRPNKL
jgi:hypothetical protein